MKRPNRSSAIGWLVVAAATVTAYAGPLRGTSTPSEAIGSVAKPFVLSTPLFTPKDGSNSTLVFASMEDVSVVVNLRRYNAVGGLLSSTNVTLGAKSSIIAFAGANSGAQMHIEIWSPTPFFTMELTYTDSGSVVQKIPYGDMLQPHQAIAGVFVPMSPFRLCDTRPAHGTQCQGTFLSPGETLNVVAGGIGGIPATASAVVLSAQAFDGSADSYFTFFPAGTTRPQISQVTFYAGVTFTNAVTVKLNSGGVFSVFNKFGEVDMLLDVAGYYT